MESRQVDGRTVMEALGEARQRKGLISYDVVREERGFLGFRGRSAVIKTVLRSRPAEDEVEEPSGSRVEDSASEAVGVEEAAPMDDSGRVEEESGEPRFSCETERQEPRLQEDESGDGRVEELAQLLDQILSTMGLDAMCSIERSEGVLTLDIGGQDRARILEDGGRILSALQVIVSRIAIKWGLSRKIRLESGNYRAARDSEVASMADEAIAEVESGRAHVRLPPMNPYERRMVHIAVGERRGLASRSEGDGFMKRVLISRNRRRRR